MTEEQFKIPEGWGLSPQQEFVIGLLIDEAGNHVSAYGFCEELYGAPSAPGMLAPAKLRVLIQRCRELVSDLTDGRSSIVVRRGSGWMISRKGVLILKKNAGVIRT